MIRLFCEDSVGVLSLSVRRPNTRYYIRMQGRSPGIRRMVGLEVPPGGGATKGRSVACNKGLDPAACVTLSMRRG